MPVSTARPHRSTAAEQLVLDASPPPPASPTQRGVRAPDAPLRIAPTPATPPAEATDRVDLTQPLLDAESLAKMLCVKRKRIYELARRPDDPLPSVRIGRAVRFVCAQVEQWVAGQAPH